MIEPCLLVRSFILIEECLLVQSIYCDRDWRVEKSKEEEEDKVQREAFATHLNVAV